MLTMLGSSRWLLLYGGESDEKERCERKHTATTLPASHTKAHKINAHTNCVLKRWMDLLNYTRIIIMYIHTLAVAQKMATTTLVLFCHACKHAFITYTRQQQQHWKYHNYAEENKQENAIWFLSPSLFQWDNLPIFPNRNSFFRWTEIKLVQTTLVE